VRRRLSVPALGGARALILHRSHATVEALGRQLGAIGLRWEGCWPQLPADALAADYVFFDVDMGHDAQFPWEPGQAPMPTVALIGSEAPGRIEWALSMGADAQMLKPVGDGGVYAALLLARAAFERSRALEAETLGLRARLAERQTVVRAVLALAARGMDEEAAYSELRRRAQAARITIEEAAARVATEGGAHVRRR
jgi:two-component system, response regulator / RNA-binding antiterminator